MILRQWVLFVVLATIAGSICGSAQTFGEITGTVTDSSGAVAAGASVTLLNTATSQARKVSTNEGGNYTIPFVPPGVYEVRVQKDGFKSATRSEVRVQVADSVRVNFTIEVGSVTESIEVQGRGRTAVGGERDGGHGDRQPAHR